MLCDRLPDNSGGSGLRPNNDVQLNLSLVCLSMMLYIWPGLTWFNLGFSLAPADSVCSIFHCASPNCLNLIY